MCNSSHQCGGRKKNKLCVASAIPVAKASNGSGGRGDQKNHVLVRVSLAGASGKRELYPVVS